MPEVFVKTEKRSEKDDNGNRRKAMGYSELIWMTIFGVVGSVFFGSVVNM